MKKYITITLIFSLLMLSLTSCTGSKNDAEPEKIDFVLDWTPNTNHTGLYVAIEKGYFKDRGFEIRIVQPSQDGAELMVSSGQGQFGVSFQDYLIHGLVAEHPLDIKAVAAVVQHNTSGIISRKGEGMDRPKGLSGKSYATWDLPIEKAMIKEVVEADGGDFEKIKMLPSNVTDEVAALSSKQVDAIWVYAGWGGIATEVAGLETDYFAFADISPVLDYYTPVIIANNNYLKDNPDRARAFLAALKDGYEFAIEKPEEAAEILLKHAPELDRELVLESQKYLSPLYKAEVNRWGYIDVARWDGFFNWLYEENLIDKKLEEGAGFSNDYLPE